MGLTKKSSKLVINLVQNVATPHNNVLIKQFVGRDDVKLNLWYANASNTARYQWGTDITNQYFVANVYGLKINISFLWYLLTHWDERVIVVGWSNINTQLLHLLFFLFRRRFNHWTDTPNPKLSGMSKKKKLLRWFLFHLLLYSRCRVLGVGKTAIDYFKDLGFPEKKLVNLPVFVTVDDNLDHYKINCADLFSKFDVPLGGFLLSAGSRLVFDKGYDLLIQAISELDEDLRKKIKLVIVGSGDELDALENQIEIPAMKGIVRIEKWMDFADFKSLIANSDIFIHPARFDAYGGTTLGMSLCVPVIGSTGAGAAVDRIEHGINGFLYDAHDTKALAGYITKLLSEPSLRLRIGKAGKKTAMQWHPKRGIQILLNHTI
jgi:glycosyltransferase involved in cell wall biosynthesis